jgi:hypothetical protein
MEWLTIPATFLYANITEYVAHRGPMHHRFRGLRMVFKDHTLEHHHYFTSEWMEMDGMRDLAAILFPPFNLFLFVGVSGITVAFLLGMWISANVGYLFLAVALGITPTTNCSTWPTHARNLGGRLPFMKGCGCTTRDIMTSADVAVLLQYYIPDL